MSQKDTTQNPGMCKEKTACALCVRAPVRVFCPLYYPLLPLLGVNQSFYYLMRRDTPTVEPAL